MQCSYTFGKLLGLSLVPATALAIAFFVNRDMKAVQESPAEEPANGRLIDLANEGTTSLRLSGQESAKLLGIKLDEVKADSAPEPMRLPGTLSVDPQRFVRVHSRFAGEIVSLEEVQVKGAKRQLRYGDRVEKGDLLATIWSKEIGEKKSELVDALSRTDLSQGLLKRLESLNTGVVADRLIVEARRNLEADLIALARAERTLRSWRVDEAEIEAIRQEAVAIRKNRSEHDPQLDRKWAEIEIRSPLSGVIVEKNYNVGDMIDPEDDLFKIADMQRLQVVANVYEEDLWEIRALSPDARRWSLDLKSDPKDNRIQGSFELIGSVIDPAQRTGVLMGWLDNSEGKLAIGQFLTATIQLPRSPSIVSIPESAVIEEGDSTTVFVETDAANRVLTRRKVAVVRRSHGVAYVDSKPMPGKGEPLSVGERVVSAGALSLGGELENLVASRPDKSTIQSTK